MMNFLSDFLMLSYIRHATNCKAWHLKFIVNSRRLIVHYIKTVIPRDFLTLVHKGFNFRNCALK